MIPPELLLAVLADPADDFPRTVAADWLEEHGHPERAEFIRVQVELARLEAAETCDREDEPNGCRPFKPEGKCFPCQRKVPLWVRKRELLFALCRDAPQRFACGGGYTVAITAGYYEPSRPIWKLFHADGGVEIANVEFRRGFVAAVSLPYAAFLAHCKALWRQQPIEEVRLTDREPSAVYTDHAKPAWWNTGNYTGDPDHDPEDLPPDLWALLVCPEKGNQGDGWKNYDTLNAAHAALSAACIAYARREAWKCPRCKGRGYTGTDSLADAFGIELKNRQCKPCLGQGWYVGVPVPAVTP